MLSILVATTKFHQYIFGKPIAVYNDHKPLLEAIFKKPLLSAPMRLQRMLLKLQCYDISVNYQKGSDMQLADTLSRAYLPEQPGDGEEFEYVNMTNFISISSTKYQEIQQLTANELNTCYHTILPIIAGKLRWQYSPTRSALCVRWNNIQRNAPASDGTC